MKNIFLLYCFLLVSFVGCLNEPDEKVIQNRPPRTFFWLYPDSTIQEGNSRQKIHWWGEDPDGIIVGYLFAFDTIPINSTTTWRWITAQETLVAFPLLTKRDTFFIGVRAVDNTLQKEFVINKPGSIQRFDKIPEHVPIYLGSSPYWDVNENGIYEVSEDVAIPSLHGAMDPVGAFQPVPVLNQPPKVVWAQNPNDPTVEMQQPETTFTAVSFSWIGSDPDGDHTIVQYEIALNDTSPDRWVALKSTVKIVSLVVPRSRSDVPGISEVEADLYSGTFRPTPRRIDTTRIKGLRLNNTNILYLRARDIAGDASRIIRMPPLAEPPSPQRIWYVKKPEGRLLLVSDYNRGDRATVYQFYQNVIPQLGPAFQKFEFLDIGRGLTTAQKQLNMVGVMVPPFIDPALIFTLHLFDIVLWYTDGNPCLGVALDPLYQYTRDLSHKGRLIYTTMFETSADPRGALKEFAPIDSIGTADLVSAGRLLPTMGDTRIPGGYFLYPDSIEARNFPPLQLNILPPSASHSIYMRPIYARPDARRVYYIQPDQPRGPTIPPLVRYVHLVTLKELKSIVVQDSYGWVCGADGIVIQTSDAGKTWTLCQTNVTDTLNSITFIQNKALAVGNAGTIISTQDGGNSWTVDRSIMSIYNLRAVKFASPTFGAVVGTRGIIVLTSDGGQTWYPSPSRTKKNLNAIDFFDDNVGIAVGDSGIIARTTNAGVIWDTINYSVRRLNSVKFLNSDTVIAVGENGYYIFSTNKGQTWVTQPAITNRTLNSIAVTNEVIWVCGNNGTLFKSVNNGASWINVFSGVTQHLNSIAFTGASTGWIVGSGGLILKTEDGGANWFTQPDGKIYIASIDGDREGESRFMFLGLPLHLLNGDGTFVKPFLEHVIFREFGFSYQ